MFYLGHGRESRFSPSRLAPHALAPEGYGLFSFQAGLRPWEEVLVSDFSSLKHIHAKQVC